MIDWSKWKSNVDGAIALLEEGGNSRDGTLHMQTGRPYKPWSISTINALRRRGYKVEALCRDVFVLHPKTGESK